jgi:PKD repeat protein
MVRFRHLILIIALVVVLSAMLAVGAGATPGPMVNRPDSPGPYAVGFVDSEIQTSSKAYSTPVKYFYPAQVAGMNERPDASDAPYPTIVWLPFFGGDAESGTWPGELLSSYGFVVVSVGVNWTDFPRSGNKADLEDILDKLEDMNGNSSTFLHTMIDTAAYGISGYSSGGGLGMVGGGQVDRFSAVHLFAPAIGTGSVDSLAPLYDIPIICQIGQQDGSYIAGSRRAYQQLDAPNSLVEIVGAGHGGPFVDHLLVSFYLYYLSGDQDYRTFLYGEEALNDVASGLYYLKFKLPDGTFFPPQVQARASKTSIPIDETIDLNVTTTGYAGLGHASLLHEWDMDGDGNADITQPGMPNVSHAFAQPGSFEITYTYHLGAVSISASPFTVNVQNVVPIAVAGPDFQATQDSEVLLDGRGSHDTPSDNDRLLFKWELDSGFSTGFVTNPSLRVTFTEVGEVTATLTVKDPHGAEASDSLEITVVNVPPIADSGADMEILEDEQLDLRGYGNDTLSDIASLRYRWDFGDGQSTDWFTVPWTIHTYSFSGEYNVTFHVRDRNGAHAIDYLTVVVSNVAPEATIVSPENGTSHEKDSDVDFIGIASDTLSDFDSLEFLWDFGDGSLTDWGDWDDAQTSHLYVKGGTYNVTLTVRDDDSTEVMVTVDITIVNSPPTAFVIRPGPDATVTEDSDVIFEGTGMDTPSDDASLTFAWWILDTMHEGKRVTVSFPTSGTYEATFTVTDPDGGGTTRTITLNVTNVAPVLVANIEPQYLFVNGSINYTAQIIDTPSDMEGVTILWDFGDEGSFTDVSGTHVFNSAGNFTVKVTITDEDGAWDSMEFLVQVTAPSVPPPPIPPDDINDDDSGARSTAYYAGAVAGIVVVAMVALFILRKQRLG